MAGALGYAIIRARVKLTASTGDPSDPSFPSLTSLEYRMIEI